MMGFIENYDSSIVIDNLSLLNSKYDSFVFKSEFEQAVIGILKKSDVNTYSIKDAIKVQCCNGVKQKGAFMVPRELSFSLLRLCQKNSLIPIIGHTHPIYYKDIYVSFSESDMKFIESFVNVAKKMEIYESFFTVTNGIYIRNLFYSYNKVYDWIERDEYSV